MMEQATHAQSGSGLDFASPARRLGGGLLDIGLGIVTLGIGWLIWWLIVAGRGQSPAKQILGMRVVRMAGEQASYSWMLLRDIGVIIVGFAVLELILAAITSEDIGGTIAGILFLVCGLWCFWDAKRQCLWDKLLGTCVVRAEGPGGVPAAAPSQEARQNLETLQDLHERGLLTDEEYEERRAREVERL